LGCARNADNCRVRPAVALLDDKILTMANRYRVFTHDSFPYFVTCTIVDWLPIFQDQAYGRIILDSLAYLQAKKGLALNAFVLMPSHLHAILRPEIGVSLSDILRDFKRYTSKAISDLATQRNQHEFLQKFRESRQNNRAQNVSQFQVWQEGSHPEVIFTEQFAKQKLDYIHKNPLRANLVETAEEWPYSSAGAYFSDRETYPPVELLVVK
jgi:REP element-mobilizing transposase RayT